MIFKSLHPKISIPEVPITPFVLREASRLKDKPALIDGITGRGLSYGELSRGVKQLAAGLSSRGFEKGDTVGILSPNVPEYALVMMAVALLGGTSTTINPLYRSVEVGQQLGDAAARYVFTHSNLLNSLTTGSSPAGEIFLMDGQGENSLQELMGVGTRAPEPPISPVEDVVVLPYSSGTTGLPKGVMLTHYNLVANICQLDAVAGLDPLGEQDTVIGVLPFFHIYGMVVVLLRTLSRGATLVTMPRFELETFLGIVQDHSVTRAYVVPPIVLALAKHPAVEKYDLSSLKAVMSGAAPLSGEVAATAAGRLGCLLKQGYGMTEASPVTHLSPDQTDKLESIGPPVPNTECKILDVASGTRVGTNQEGELWVRGPQVMKGYLNNAQATAQGLDEEGWLRTGDVGYADEDGYFYIVDRVKELIKYKGFQVAPAELEGILLSHPAVSDAAVIGSPDEEAGEVPKAFVVLKQEISTEEIIDFVAGCVAPHKKIRRVERVEEIPKSASGKILRRVLVEQERRRTG